MNDTYIGLIMMQYRIIRRANKNKSSTNNIRSCITTGVIEKAISDIEKAISDIEKAISDIEKAKKSLKHLFDYENWDMFLMASQPEYKDDINNVDDPSGID